MTMTLPKPGTGRTGYVKVAHTRCIGWCRRWMRLNLHHPWCAECETRRIRLDDQAARVNGLPPVNRRES